MSDAINEDAGGAGLVIPSREELATIFRMLRNIRINGRLGTVSPAGIDFFLNLTPTPFLGWIDPDNVNKVIIGADRAEAWYPWLDTIYVEGTGLTLNKAAAETIAITADCFVYYAVDASAGPPITAVLGVTTPVPDDTDSLRHVVLGYAEWDVDHVAWYKQQHFGNLYVLPALAECDCPQYLTDLLDVDIT